MKGKQKFDWASGIQFTGSLFMILLLAGISLGGIGFVALSSRSLSVPVPAVQTTTLLLFFSSLGFVGFLLLPSMLYAAKSLFGLSTGEEKTWRGADWLIALYPILLGVGYLAEWETGGGRFLLVLAHVLANGVAVFWILHLSQKGLPEGSPQRFWGAFGSGLTLAPALVLLLELLLLILIGGMWYLYLLEHPALKAQITRVLERLPQSVASPVILERMASKYLFLPGIVTSVFTYVAVLIPLVEELIKPLGVWLLIKKKITPAQGYKWGMVSGAGYALFENLALSANAGTWTIAMISRFGTTAVHMLTAAYVGWGLASSWTEENFMRLAKAFFVSVLFHGVWNGLNILSALGQFSGAREFFGPFGYGAAQVAPVGIFLLALGAIYGLIRSRWVLGLSVTSSVENE
ncbi:MAG: PrsW family intramembrane metalloprotease [Anaerolineales bacterium]|nr:PrsW family intramembrane metalloprotease [Anaerolineales bacterium]